MDHYRAFPTWWNGMSHLIPVINWDIFPYWYDFRSKPLYWLGYKKDETTFKWQLYPVSWKKTREFSENAGLNTCFLVFQPNMIERPRVPQISSSYKIYENKLCLPRRRVGKQNQQLFSCQKLHSTDMRPARTRWEISVMYTLTSEEEPFIFGPDISSL